MNRRENTETFELRFGGLEGVHMRAGEPAPIYPMWLYKEGEEPLKVYNTDEDKEARLQGWDAVTAGHMANRFLINWFWDLEDFSAKQLRYFALEEYGVDLPIKAGQDKLFKAVIELTRHAPRHQGQLVMMAHTISMNYDATMEEIRRLADCPPDATVENIYEEFTA